METLPEEWLTEFEREEENPVLMDKMDTLDDLTPQQFAALFNEEFENTFSTSSNANAISSLFVQEESQICNERPTKQRKSSTSNSWSSGNTEPRSSSSPESSPFPNSAKSRGRGVTQNKRAAKPTARTATCTRDHVIAERKRREKLTQQFIALSAIVPGLKKMDKASVLGDCMIYIKNLQTKVKTLEEQTSRKTMEAAVFVRKFEVSSNTTDEKLDDFSQEPLPEVQAKVSERNVLIRIHSEKHKGILAHTLMATEQLNLIVISSGVLPFGSSTFEITVLAQMEAEFNLTVKALVEKLHSSITKFITIQGETICS
ncbi:hypothetical protein ACHQM5_023142 [Ranunculus cassubicifolius]